MAVKGAFDFLDGDAEAADLLVVVSAAEAIERALGIVAGEVAGAPMGQT